MGVLERHTGRLYGLRFSEAERRRKERIWAVIAAWLSRRYVSADATVVDLGAGSCELINQISAGRRIAVDLSPSLEKDAGPGVETLQVSVDAISQHIERGSVDVVIASNVLEHLRSPEILLSVLEQAFELLRPGGKMIVLQPNVRHVGVGFWDFVDHTLPLTEKGMIEALSLAGFGIAEVRSRFLPYTTKGRFPQHPILVRAYLRIRPLHWVLGKQMLVIAERPLDG